MYRILVSDKLGAEGIERLAQERDVSFDVKTDLSESELLSEIQNYDALLVRSGTQVTESVLDAGSKLRVVGRAGMGVDNIDVKAATQRGVIVMNTPGANSIATAEHTMTMLLALLRHTAPAHNAVQNGAWQRSQYGGRQLYRKVLGLIGFGRIARLVAKRAKAFEMEVIAYDPYVSEQIGMEVGVKLVDMDELLEQADIISLHTSLSADTKHIINEKTIACMKQGVTIINPSRGDLVDEEALKVALNQGKVKAAAIDVYSQEPPPPDHPLIGLTNVLHTPHLGASTEEAQRDVSVQIVEQVVDVLRNQNFRNSVNMPFSAGPGFDKILPYMRLGEKIGILQFHMADKPIRKIELEVCGDTVKDLVKPIATGLLKGYVDCFAESVNYINAPVLADQHGIQISEARGLAKSAAGGEFSNTISCKVHWQGGNRTITGILMAGEHPRIVQVSDYVIDANPTGMMLIMLNKDVPGVIGQVGTLLGKFEINIGEWRLGRPHIGDDALSFINLDSQPSPEAMTALADVAAVKKIKVVNL